VNLRTVNATRAARIERTRSVMETVGVDALALSVGSDLPYLTGYRAMATERLTMLIVTATAADLVVPELEAPRVEPGPFDVVAWAETDDPIAIVSSLASGAQTVAIGDQAWAVFLVRLQQALPETSFQSATPLMRTLRIRKDEAELAALRAAAADVDRVVAHLATTDFAGRSERDLSREIRDLTLAEGHQEATFAIVASGPNGASPHHEAGDRIIEPGDLVVVDFGGRRDGYASDTTRTFAVGEPGDEQATAYQVLHAAQVAACDAVRPGVAAQEIDRVARAVISAAGYGDRFIHRTGHGIGMDGHEDPYLVAGNTERVDQGMAFSIEPGIYTSGSWGMRIEDIVAVTATGVERLNRSDRRLYVVG